MHPVALDAVERVALLVRERALNAGQEHVDIAGNRVERRPELVAHEGEKIGFGGGRLRRLDLRLSRFVLGPPPLGDSRAEHQEGGRDDGEEHLDGKETVAELRTHERTQAGHGGPDGDDGDDKRTGGRAAWAEADSRPDEHRDDEAGHQRDGSRESGRGHKPNRDRECGNLQPAPRAARDLAVPVPRKEQRRHQHDAHEVAHPPGTKRRPVLRAGNHPADREARDADARADERTHGRHSDEGKDVYDALQARRKTWNASQQ